MIAKLAEALNLDEGLAQTAVDTVVDFLKDRLPENLHGVIENLGEGGEDVAGGAIDAVKGLFGE
ncbi:MAG: hypothetical protein AAGC74_12285 [Verrucomicrobiota bacterium]